MAKPGLARSMAAGLGVDLGAAVLVRGLSLATTVVVARALHEADYGAVSLALAIFGVSDMLTNPALGVAVLRRSDLDDRTIDVAWTLSLVRSVLLSGFIYLAAPLLAQLWHGAGATVAYLRILSLAPLTSALANMHALRLQRDLRFGAAMLLDNSRLLAASAASLALLVVTRSAQALVTGVIVGNVVYAILSWIVISPRPRFALAAGTARELTTVSRWLMANSILVYLCVTVDNLYVGRSLGLAALGVYALAWRVVNTVMTLFTRAISKMLIPAYRKVGHDVRELRRVLLAALFPSTTVGALASALTLLVAPDVFSLMAGRQHFAEAATVARALTPFVYSRILNNVLGPLYQGVAEPRTLTFLSTLNLVLLVPSIYFGAALGGATGVGVGVSLSATVVSVVFVVLARRRFELDGASLLRATLLPLLAAVPCLAAGSALLRVMPHAGLIRLSVVSAFALALYVLVWEGLRRVVSDLPSLLTPLRRVLGRRLPGAA